MKKTVSLLVLVVILCTSIFAFSSCGVSSEFKSACDSCMEKILDDDDWSATYEFAKEDGKDTLVIYLDLQQEDENHALLLSGFFGLECVSNFEKNLADFDDSGSQVRLIARNNGSVIKDEIIWE